MSIINNIDCNCPIPIPHGCVCRFDMNNNCNYQGCCWCCTYKIIKKLTDKKLFYKNFVQWMKKFIGIQIRNEQVRTMFNSAVNSLKKANNDLTNLMYTGLDTNGVSVTYDYMMDFFNQLTMMRIESILNKWEKVIELIGILLVAFYETNNIDINFKIFVNFTTDFIFRIIMELKVLFSNEIKRSKHENVVLSINSKFTNLNMMILNLEEQMEKI